jgi:hypothetical protein
VAEAFVQVRVDTHDGYKAGERPTAFELEGERHEVAEVLDRWYEGSLDPRGQQIDYFKVRTTRGLEFILRYLHLFDAWSARIGS